MTTATQVKERPILFSTPMVQAILEGRKTMTRRVVKPQPNELATGFRFKPESWPDKLWVASYRYDGPLDIFEITDRYRCPYGQIGDILWARETWSWDWLDYPECTKKYYYYKADTPAGFLASGETWKPSIHMPRAACRIRLRITDIRVEQVQDITQEDAMAEGAFFTDYGRICYHNGMDGDIDNCPADQKDHPLKNGWSMHKTQNAEQCLGSARAAFANIWQSINGTDSWNVDPWTWCITFENLQTP